MGLCVPAPLFSAPAREIHWTFQWLFSSAKYDSEGKKKQHKRKDRKEIVKLISLHDIF